MALGAEAKTVRRMFVWQGAQVALLGVVVGALAAVGLTTYIQTLLFDVGRLDVDRVRRDVCRDACGRAAGELHPGAARLACEILSLHCGRNNDDELMFRCRLSYIGTFDSTTEFISKG